MAHVAQLTQYIDQLLAVDKFKDYGPNGLQVEGKKEINRMICGVTASLALIDAAIEQQADAILVHHGYFWKGEDPCLVGMKAERIRRLLQHDINLLAYHLPLDAHGVLGNNVQLAKRLGINIEGRFIGDRDTGIGMYGSFPTAMSGEYLSKQIDKALARTPMHIKGSDRPIQRIAWCTGGAQGYFEEAVALGVDAYITGEVSEYTVHIAREYGVHFFAAGHHATERYGVQALGRHLAEKFGLHQQYIEIENPV
ncbi:MAG: Nif3-like dinuclear metal center hexameric protein [Gammaproteobacteria bacterium]|nr:Nif3-like dinuclear metal center hexameric protein [Gammaproteobacteria bacterium]